MRQSHRGVEAAGVSPANGKPNPARPFVDPDNPDAGDLMAGTGSQVVVIRPDVACKILAYHNTGNRPISESLAKSYAGLMKDGLWKLNGETLIFAAGGRVLDGQHRLLGCVMAGVPFRTWVVMGADPTAFDTIDRGRKRKTSDDLGIEGEKNTSRLAAALAIIWLEESGRIMEIGQTPPSQVARSVLRNHPDLRASVSWVVGHNLRELIQPRLAAYCHYRFHQRSPKMASDFFDRLGTGIGVIDRHDPVYHLRERLLEDRVSKAKLKPVEVLALIIKAWNCHVGGGRMRVLRWKSGESFPEILG